MGSEFRGKLKEILNINSSIGEAPPWYFDCPTYLTILILYWFFPTTFATVMMAKLLGGGGGGGHYV